MSFPESFLWGAATSAYQVEGSPLADGAGESIWHRFAHAPGNVLNGEHGDVAADHYHRYEEDVRLMDWLGLTSYRFSVSWSRILPQGRGTVNQKGLDFYERLVDLLLQCEIQPMVTLYHWDLPQALESEGGWLNPDVAQWFADYASALYSALDDRVSYWVTLNEPWVVADHGFRTGTLAPGKKSTADVPRVAHNLLRAHVYAARRYEDEGRHHLGIVVNLEPKHPATESPPDRQAAEREHGYQNQYFLDPLFFGRYPETVPALFGKDWPDHATSEVVDLAMRPDFVGVNYYTRAVLRAGDADSLLRSTRVVQEGRVYTDMGWEVCAGGLTEMLTWVAERYGAIPLFVTENGAAFHDPDHADVPVADYQRAAYLEAHIRAVRKAIAAGVDVRGYYAWSLLDNFEWAHGYGKRFGIIHVDYDSLERTPKESARRYREIIATRGADLP